MAIFLPFLFSVAQSSVQSEQKKGQSFGRVGVRYTNDYVYMGRADSIKAPYLSTSLGYYHSSGLFLDGSLSYLVSAEENRVDLFRASLGYDFIGEQFSAGVSASGYFFSQESYAVQSTMKGYLNSYVGYDFRLFEVYGDASMGLSEQIDFFGGLELRRTFYLLKDRLSITPSAYLNAGSQYYYTEYYATRNSKVTKGDAFGHGSGKGKGQTGMTTTTEELLIGIADDSKFQLLDYEFALMMTYKMGDFRFMIIPTLAIPVNPARVTVDQITTFEESLKNTFFWSASINYLLQRKHL